MTDNSRRMTHDARPTTLRKYRTALILLGLGLAAGILGGFLGIGGGALIVPWLVFFLNFDQPRARGTSLLAALALSTVGVVLYAQHGLMDWPMAAEMAAGGVFGALFGARAASALSGRNLRLLFVLVLVIVGLKVIVSGCLLGRSDLLPVGHPVFTWITVTGVGALGGFISALLGIGWAVIMVPAMVTLLRIPQASAQGIALAAVIPTALVGMLLHSRMGNVDLRVGKWIGLGGAAGALIGAEAALHLDVRTLMLSFGAFVLLTALLMGLKKTDP